MRVLISEFSKGGHGCLWPTIAYPLPLIFCLSHITKTLYPHYPHDRLQYLDLQIHEHVRTYIYTHILPFIHKYKNIYTHNFSTMPNQHGSIQQSSSGSGSGSGSQAINNQVCARHMTHKKTKLMREYSQSQPTKASIAPGPPKQVLMARRSASKHASLAAVQPCNAGLPKQ